MDYKKALLGAASVLALTAGIQTSADASIPPPDKPAATESAGRIGSAVSADVLFDLTMRLKGDFSAQSVEHALIDMFAQASHEQIESFPEVLASVTTLGMTSEALQRAKGVLIGIAASASGLDSNVRDEIIAQLESEPRPMRLAERKRRDPDRTGSIGSNGARDPGTTGAIGGAPAGGAYR